MRKKEFMIGPVLILTAILTGYLLTTHSSVKQKEYRSRNCRNIWQKKSCGFIYWQTATVSKTRN